MNAATRLARRMARSPFADDLRAAVRGACTVAGLLGALLILRGLIVAASIAQTAAVSR